SACSAGTNQRTRRPAQEAPSRSGVPLGTEDEHVDDGDEDAAVDSPAGLGAVGRDRISPAVRAAPDAALAASDPFHLRADPFRPVERERRREGRTGRPGGRVAVALEGPDL